MNHISSWIQLVANNTAGLTDSPVYRKTVLGRLFAVNRQGLKQQIGLAEEKKMPALYYPYFCGIEFVNQLPAVS